MRVHRCAGTSSVAFLEHLLGCELFGVCDSQRPQLVGVTPLEAFEKVLAKACCGSA